MDTQMRTGALPASDDDAGPGRQRVARESFLITLWFGLLVGWLELGLVPAMGAIHPHVSLEMLRTNRHHAWMVPASDAAIFGVVGLVLALLARFRPGLARWAAWRVPIGMGCLGLLLDVEGLYAIAALSLACGVASIVGPWLERRAEGLRRVVRASLPAMALGTLVWGGVAYERAISAEDRAIAAHPPAKAGAPNVLMIVLDTVRASCLSLYGHDRPTSPNLERLASRGVVFTEARSTAPWTAPSHASMFTGRWPHELSVGPGMPLDATFPTLAEALGREGYATAGFVGNLYYCGAAYGFGRGFDRFEDAYENRDISPFATAWSSGLGRGIIRALGYPTKFDDVATLARKSAAMLNRDLLDWLAARPSDRPFFAFVNYYDAHRPYVLPEDPGLRFGKATLPLADQLEIERKDQDLTRGKPTPGDCDTRSMQGAALELYHDCYDSCIASIDRQLGLLLDEIERRGLLEDTLVIVTSDHGEQMGERGLIVHGASVYSQEVHVPLLMIPPSRSPIAGAIREPVSLRDLPATVAQWAGLGPNNPFPGHSLARFLGDDPGHHSGSSPVFSELRDNISFPDPSRIPPPFGPASSLVSEGRAYIRKDDGGEELYDLSRDPEESLDLARDPQSGAILDQFRGELARLHAGKSPPAH